MRKNQTGQVVSAHLVSKTDGSDVTTGATTVYLTGDGTWIGAIGSATHKGQGSWSFGPSAANTNYNHAVFTFVNTSAVSVDIEIYPVSYDPTDAADLGVTALTGHTPQTGDSYAVVSHVTYGLSAIKTETAAILDDTDDIGIAGAGLTEAGGTGDHLTAINLPDQTMNITGNLSGSVGSVTNPVTVGTINTNVITAASIQDNAITAAKIADAAIDANTFAADSITSNAIATDAITNDGIAAGAITDTEATSVGSVTGAVASVTGAVTVGTINTDVITSASIQNDAITAAKIADAAIDANTFAAGAINNAAIAAGAITDTKATSVGSVTGAVASVTAEVDADVTAINGSATAAARLEALMDGVALFQVAASPTPTQTAFGIKTGGDATIDHYNGRLVTFISGALTAQQTDITDYAGSGGNYVLTVTSMTEAAAADDWFVIH